MEKRTVLQISAVLLIILGIAIIFVGLSGPKLMLPPVITGLGFFVVSWALFALKK
ncbi:hypothetical protein QG516_12660 [Pedobacter gandavensis]|uniref:hypothetical protein n=1 Tax=Pedobacter TaxID=84567 RepID=UPI001C994D75|nr:MULTISPECIES: hypothetical protein [Pedobacter]WGQ12477.1 hypothetical protein QG516_12660 [Pedobacter gandavensis]